MERWFVNEKDCEEHTEILYAHFFRRPLLVKTEVDDKFFIVPNKIIKFKSNITSSLLKHYNSRLVYLALHSRHIINKISKKIRLI